jgi:hypothetical protein
MEYPKAVVVKKDTTDVVNIQEDDLVSVSKSERGFKIGPYQYVEVRLDGEFKDKGIYLPSYDYDWQLVVDSDGLSVLVPTKKKK